MDATQFMTPEDERAQVAAAQAGDQSAALALIEAHRPMIDSQARRMAGICKAPLEDMVQSATLGVLIAIQRFDHDRPERLAAYATSDVREQLTEQRIIFSSPASVPARTLRKYVTARATAHNATDRNRASDAAALAHDTDGMAKGTFNALAYALAWPEDTSQYGEGGFCVVGSTDVAAKPVPSQLRTDSDETEICDRLAIKAIPSMLEAARLTDREDTVIRMAYGCAPYGNPAIDSEIASELGMTRPTVQRTRAAGLAKLRAVVA